MANPHVEGKWKELKGEIRNQWGKLTDDELESTKGNLTSIGGLIEQRYGDAKDKVSEKLNSLAKKFGYNMQETSEKMKDSLRDQKH